VDKGLIPVYGISEKGSIEKGVERCLVPPYTVKVATPSEMTKGVKHSVSQKDMELLEKHILPKQILSW